MSELRAGAARSMPHDFNSSKVGTLASRSALRQFVFLHAMVKIASSRLFAPLPCHEEAGKDTPADVMGPASSDWYPSDDVLTSGVSCRMYGHAFEAFKIIVTDHDQVFNRLQDETNGGQPIPALTDAVKEGIIKNVRRRMTPQPIKIRADVELTCFAYDGVLHIQVWRVVTRAVFGWSPQ